jgi:hypothetical protein
MGRIMLGIGTPVLFAPLWALLGLAVPAGAQAPAEPVEQPAGDPSPPAEDSAGVPSTAAQTPAPDPLDGAWVTIAAWRENSIAFAESIGPVGRSGLTMLDIAVPGPFVPLRAVLDLALPPAGEPPAPTDAAVGDASPLPQSSAAPSSAAQSSGTLSPKALIGAAKDAMGGGAWDKIVTWHEAGTIASGGLVGTYEGWQDLRTLHNSGAFALGPATGGSGWDGARAWTLDSSRDVRLETGGEAAAQAIQDAYRCAYGFFFPDRFPAPIEASGTRAADGKSYDSVQVTAPGAEPFEIWFDPDTHRIAREVQVTGGQRHSFIFSDFAPVDGALVPRRTIDRIGDDPKYDTTIAVETIEFRGPQPENLYAPPPPPSDSAEWPDGVDQVTVPFRLVNDHIYVDGVIDGMAPMPFLFDTGSVNILQTDAAKALGINVEGALPGGGFGDGLADFGLARIDRVSLGGLTLSDQVFGTETASGWTQLEGTESAGNLGYEFARRAVLTIDYAGQTLTFTKFQAFQPPEGAEAIPLRFNGHIPMLEGTLDGVAGEFELDTGSRGALTLMRPFATANGLIEKYHALPSAAMGYGAGGISKTLAGRAGQLVVGPITIEAPAVQILVDAAGAGAAARTAGNIGGALLKRFTVTLDYAHGRAWLEPNALASRTDVFDRSGLQLARAEDGCFTIAEVAAGSAAAAIGLEAGDEITSVNSQAAPSLDLDELREQLKGPAGMKFTLTVTGDVGDRSLILILADQA